MPKRQKTTQKSSNAAKKSKPLTTKDGHEGEACKDVDTSPVLKGTPGSNPDNHNQEPAPRYWLMKSEPESRIVNGTDVKFGIDDLLACEGCTACWDGVRNYQARNFMKDMRLGDKAFFYHSNCKDPGIAGLVEIVKGAYIDHTQFDKKDPHYDPKSTKADPKWFMVDVKFVRKMKRHISLSELKKLYQVHSGSNGPLKGMSLFTRSRLSVQPVSKEEYDFILSLEKA